MCCTCMLYIHEASVNDTVHDSNGYCTLLCEQNSIGNQCSIFRRGMNNEVYSYAICLIT